ncbi:hypothetical protein cypCar_00023682 [Cyprinus carpio]|nr:hypothetical protein cypCar_00023682 [Cyprinus carpio]
MVVRWYPDDDRNPDDDGEKAAGEDGTGTAGNRAEGEASTMRLEDKIQDGEWRCSNKDNSRSVRVNLTLSIAARAQVEIRGVSHPAQVVLPFPRWEPKEKPVREDDVGPQVQHIYEVQNKQTQKKTLVKRA